jgi:single-stranded DNA-binding protein
MLNASHFLKNNICKGKLVYVEGKIKTEKDPVNNTSEVIIMAYNTRILGEKKEGRMW